MEERQPRKLAVILHADVVGSTTLVQQNESLAHARIQDAFRRFSLTIEAYNGVTHELRGDALVAEFARASDAVEAGLAFQIENTESNAQLEDDLQPRLRIGVSLGEVVIADNTVTGPGVVLAQRVEQLAEPGGVCITGAVHEAVPQHLPLDYCDLGKREAKGFGEPVQIYSASVKAGKQVPSPEPVVSGEARSLKPKRQRTAGATALLVLVVGGLAWWQPWVPREEPASVQRMAFPMPDKPSIAVMPFTNMSGDPEQEYFVDGMTEDLITDLSKLSGLFVIARNSTFTYKGKSVKVRQVAEELGVRYVLEGSVRRAGNQVRVNAQLIDATTGGHLWAERYDGSLADVFTLQDKVTQNIVGALAVNLTSGEKTRRMSKETGNLLAYDAFLEGWTRYRLFTPDDFAKAIPHLERAIELDPNYSRAHAALAAVYGEAWYNYWTRLIGVSPVGILASVKRHLKAAMRNPTPLAHQIASLMYIIEGHYDDAIAEAEHAVALDPNDPSGHVAMARALLLTGRPAESLEFINKASRLDPRSDFLYWRGAAQFHLGRYDEAAATMIRATEHNPGDIRSFLYLASAYGHLDRKQDAESAFETYKGLRARIPILRSAGATYTSDELVILLFKRQAETERLHQGLAKLGYELPPEVVEASPEGISLTKTIYTSVVQVYDFAKEHCRKYGKKSHLMMNPPHGYVFACK